MKCLCGECDEEVSGYRYDQIENKYVLRRFKPGHQFKNVSEKTRKLRSINAKKRGGEKHPRWKGENVGIDALHTWVRKILPKPDLCEICKETEPFDLANITNNYSRGIGNWKYLCRKCHMLSDGRLEKLKQYDKKIKSRLVL